MTSIAVPLPDLVMVQNDPDGSWRAPAVAGIQVDCQTEGKALRIQVATRSGWGICRIQLRWSRPSPVDAMILGDAWERTYGGATWQSRVPHAIYPWMVLSRPSNGPIWGAGVDTRGGSFAGWTLDESGVSLWLDLRAGSCATYLEDRPLHAATVRWIESTSSPFEAQCELAASVCSDPLPSQPLVGVNNWYYAYGQGFDADAVVRDAHTIAELVGDHTVRPFSVVDDGWSIDGTSSGRPCSGGPWDAGRPDRFHDMAEVAARIRAEGVRPGIWFRPLQSRVQPKAGGLRQWEGGWALDPSHPATLESVAGDIRRFRAWGFELIKHDFSTYETLGRWGFQMGARPAGNGIQPHDRSRTTAETLGAFYRTIHDAADGGVILGCNVVGHLAAGLVHAQRTGDDTSGRQWEQTRRMGVNALAFRLAQHRRFFTIDADCVPCTPQTDWSLNRQFLDLIARSGTALFVSVDPACRTAATDEDLSAALRLALDGGVAGGIEPLDWLFTSTPAYWRSGSTEVHYDWYGPSGADPYDPVS